MCGSVNDEYECFTCNTQLTQLSYMCRALSRTLVHTQITEQASSCLCVCTCVVFVFQQLIQYFAWPFILITVFLGEEFRYFISLSRLIRTPLAMPCLMNYSVVAIYGPQWCISMISLMKVTSISMFTNSCLMTPAVCVAWPLLYCQ